MRQFSFGFRALVCSLLLTGWVWGQGAAFPTSLGSSAAPFWAATPTDNSSAASALLAPTMPSPAIPVAELPRMSPELALHTYQQRTVQQTNDLASYSARSVIKAELPDAQEQGELIVERHYTAPRTLEFKAVHYSGDGFVKTNVITRVLQSEVDHVQKDDFSLTAITPANYKFSYKGTAQLDGRTVHAYQLKPRRKRVGLFKGRMYLDVHTGALVCVEGRSAKSPSLFVSKIEFRQDYADFGSFTFPVHNHSEARTRLIGRAIVDIDHRDYQPTSITVMSARTAAP